MDSPRIRNKWNDTSRKRKSAVLKKGKNNNQHRRAGCLLLLLDLHGETFHVSVFKVEAEVLPAEAHILRHAVSRQPWGL